MKHWIYISVWMTAAMAVLMAGGCATAPGESAVEDSGTIYEAIAVDRPPELRVTFPPAYPPEMLSKNVAGEVLVEFIVDAKGNVQTPQVLRASHPEFGFAVIAAVSRWKFAPGRVAGSAVTTRLQIPLKFSPPQGPHGSARGEDEVADMTSVDALPTPLVRVPPLYPAELRLRGIKGEVMVEFLVDKQGNVQHAWPVDAPDPALAEAAVAAVKQWKFTPAKRKGKTVVTRMQVPIIFDLPADTKEKRS